MNRLYPLIAALMLTVAACGGGGSDPVTPTRSLPDSTATAVSAASLLPNLAGEGFRQLPPEPVPNPVGIDIMTAVYERAGPPPLTARLEIRVYVGEEGARSDFTIQAEGWRSPPPGVFGGDPANVRSSPLEGIDDARAYVSSNRDPQGNRIWTDVYRIGSVVTVSHVLGSDEAESDRIRSLMASSIKAALAR